MNIRNLNHKYLSPTTNILYILLCCFLILLPLSVSALEKQAVMGAGPSTSVAKLFFQNFSMISENNGYIFNVEDRSIKHAGGIRASDKYLFGRIGRPLNSHEIQLDKKELFLARIPLTFVSGKKAGVDNISSSQLQAILTRKIINWKELGGSDHNIILVGREPNEAALGVLKSAYPYIHNTQFDIIFKRDHQIVNFIKSKKGDYALSFGAKSNFNPGNILKTEGFSSGLRLGLVYDKKNAEHPLVKAAIEFVKTPEWQKILNVNGYLLPE